MPSERTKRVQRVPTPEAIARVRQKIEEQTTRLQALEARASQDEQARDARRRMLLGRLLLEAAETDARFAKVVTILMERITRDHDRRVFKGWTPPTPKAEHIEGRSEAEPEQQSAPSATAHDTAS